MNIIEIFTKSIFLIISFDSDLWEIIILSLYVSISALIIASILGLLLGYYIALKKFLFKKKSFNFAQAFLIATISAWAVGSLFAVT